MRELFKTYLTSWNREKTVLVTAISGLVVLGFLVTSLASFVASRESLRAELSLTELPLTGDTVYSEIQRDLLRPVFISSLMANDTFLRDWVIAGEHGTEQITKYLNEIETKYNTFTSFFVSEKSRIYYHSGGILKTVSPDSTRDEWYFRVRDMANDYEINVDPDMANRDAMTIFINYRVFDYDGDYIGVTGVGLTVTAVKSLVEAYQKKYNSTIYFIDDTGAIRMSGSRFDSTLTTLASEEYFAAFREKLASRSECSFRYAKHDHQVHANIRYIEELGWYLVVEQPEEDLIRPIFATLLTNLAICFLVTAVVMILVVVSVTAYQNRIETLRGIVPICSHCKKIRDDKGYWNQVEAYVGKFTDAKFSHSICPTCQEQYYPNEYKQIQAKKARQKDAHRPHAHGEGGTA